MILNVKVSCILSQDTCLDGVTIEKTQTWSTGYIGKLILDQSWLQQHKSTSDWTLDLGFCSEVTEFKVRKKLNFLFISFFNCESDFRLSSVKVTAKEEMKYLSIFLPHVRILSCSRSGVLPLLIHQPAQTK